ncbi:MAG: diguanylate cyclase domain-containing protein [Syntrophobacteraceae bacterium]
MPEQVNPAMSSANEQALQAEIVRLNKIIQALMNRAERNASVQGSDFNLFHTAITLENQVRRRTEELEAALLENEKITRALRESENRNRLIVDTSPMSIHEIDLAGRIIFMNRSGLLMRGVKEQGEVQGSLYVDAVNVDDRERIGGLLAKAYAGETSHFEFEAILPRRRILKSCFVPIKNKDGGVERVLGITEDITERKEAEEYIRNLAFYDPLTQLPNRRLLNDRFGQVKAVNKRSLRYGAVMFLDLDNFKLLNDTYGHDMGDLLLIEVAHRITRCVREMETVARLGGDEFVVMLSELAVDKEVSAAKAGILAERIRTNLAKPYLLTGKLDGNVEITVEHHCTSSIGVVLFKDQETRLEDILKWADMAMYKAKQDGRNTVRFSDEIGY